MIRTKQRWILLIKAVIVMIFISIYQYSWSLFASGLKSNLDWSMAEIQVAFTLYSYVATFIQPLSGYFADRFGPRKIAVISGLLTVSGILLNYTITSPLHLYIYYTIGSIGVGILYGISTAIAVKWFPDKKGLATGIITFGFSAGTASLNLVFQEWILKYGVKITFLFIGILMSIFVLPSTFFYEYPEMQLKQQENEKNKEKRVDWRWHEMLRTYQWWFIYTSFTIIAAITLLFCAQIVPIAKANNIPLDVLSFVLVAYPLANGLSRILGGWLSDRMGCQLVAMLFYTLSGAMMLALGFTASNPLGFSFFVVLAMLFSGAAFTFNPMLIGEFYGSKYLTTNYGITYTAKGWGGLISGYIAAWLLTKSCSYTFIIIGLGIGALVAAVFINPWILKRPEIARTK